VACLVLLVGMELFARFGLGLGDPPLMMRDDQIEYLARPSMTYSRFGNRVSYNQWSMRSDGFLATKSDPNELRVLVLGDSVVNGGAQTDQADIATEIIRQELAAKLNRPVTVGNISAGSWGPPNLLAYVKKFGLFDADAVVIVLSSHDAADVPTFGPLGVDAPEHTPLLALQEVVQRYLPRYVPWLRAAGDEEPERSEFQLESDREQSLAALRELIQLATESGARILVIQHAERSELSNGLESGHAEIRTLLTSRSVDRIDLGPKFAASIAAGSEPYRDNIHPNEVGQRLLAEAILEWLSQP
jgi:lysophospholipase L1-like esterase